MVLVPKDASPRDAATFLLEKFGMPRKSPKELQPVPVAELDSWSRQLSDAAEYLRAAVEKARSVGIDSVMTHAKEVRRNVPALRKWSQTASGLVDDAKYASETGQPTVKEQMALKHAKAAAAKAKRK